MPHFLPRWVSPGWVGPQEPKPESFSFPSFSSWLASVPELLQGILALRKSDASFKLIGLLASFLLKFPQKAAPSSAADFAAHCREATSDSRGSQGGSQGASREAFGHFFVEPLIHVASVLGGLLSQEVIKVRRVDQLPPFCAGKVNSVCFNAHTGAALVEHCPAVPAAPKKRKAEEERQEMRALLMQWLYLW
eukprot:Skav213310  [mRNA]  locus=scaffold1383:89203:94510:+ [translate_table: standard]